MIDRDGLEKSLLLGIVRDKNWDVLLLNNVTRDCFSPANLPLYDYIKGFANEGKYPDIRIVTNIFDIPDDEVPEYLMITALDELCDALHSEYVKNQLRYKVENLNAFNSEVETDPVSYVDRLGRVVEEVRQISYHTKSVDPFENIEEILKIDKSNVISSGFRELDEKLIGFKRGEELVVLAGRTGQGKTWMGLKFAMSAAFQGNRVGLYSGEMSTQQIQERMLCCAKPAYTATQEEAMQVIKEKDAFVRVLTQKELRRRANVSDIEEFIIRDNLDMVVIDQLSLMEDNTSKPRYSIKTAIWKYKYGFIFFDH